MTVKQYTIRIYITLNPPRQCVSTGFIFAVHKVITVSVVDFNTEFRYNNKSEYNGVMIYDYATVINKQKVRSAYMKFKIKHETFFIL